MFKFFIAISIVAGALYTGVVKFDSARAESLKEKTELKVKRINKALSEE